MIEKILAAIQNLIVDWHSYIQGAFGWKNIFEILIIISLLMLIYQRFIRNTHSEKFVKGAFVLVFLWIFSEVLIAVDLQIIGVFLRSVVLFIALSLIVIFQPELRKALEQLGSRNFIANLIPDDVVKHTSQNTVEEVVKATFEMAKKKTGALIVIQQDQSLKDIEDTGIRINGLVTSALLINIFEKNTPLHDGAVVIVGDKVTSATCYLPLSDTDISKDYGTRHRAALGVSEVTDAITVVVSEETGKVSVAVNGALRRVQDAEALRAVLPNVAPGTADKNGRFRLFRSRGKENRV
jgi:diadenylate cyclase